MPELFVVATPIGNLKDITLRALEILKGVDFILAEDTRVTRKLLIYYKIDKPLISYHQHSRLNKIEKILDILREGKNIALVSDAGTPGISDPGNKLIEEILQNKMNVKITPIPGPSAVLAIASVAGIFMDNFKFAGFPPQKKGRNKYFKKILESDVPVIFFESPHRIIKTLQQIKFLITDYGLLITDYGLVVGRELTKKFETIYRGNVEEVLNDILNNKIKGEFVIIVQNLT